MGYPVPLDEQMLVSAVRYALGRKTSVVWTTCDQVRAAWPNLSRSARAVILRDVTEALNEATAKDTHVGMEIDHRSWGQLVADIVSGDITDPKADTEEHEELGPEHGYPSEEELQRLAAFRGTPRELVEYVQSIWRNGGGTSVTRETAWSGREEVVATFVTGGWSGCEEIIGVLGNTLALMYSHSWKRGGLHSYAFPAAVYDADKSWDWELLPGEPRRGDGPYAEVRDRLAALEAAGASL